MMPDAPRTVRVALGERSYDILIGSGMVAEAGHRIAGILPAARAVIVTDEQVASLHLQALVASLDAAGISATHVLVPPGEASKSFDQFRRVTEAVLDARLERGDVLIALGGGVVGDLAGFVAASVRRGMHFVQVPTTLLSQVDSSVGGKTGINAPQGKNLVGAFWQPKLVVADTGVLDTLSPREFRAGYAEVAKYGLIDKPGFFGWLEANHAEIFAGGPARTEAIAVSCEAKAAIVARDETETGDRALLNLGHTFGHALEAAAGYDGRVLVHGEGVAIGMAMAHRFSSRMNLASPDDAARVSRHLAAVGLPDSLAAHGAANLEAARHFADIGADRLLAYMAQDKKVSRGTLTFILTRGIGQSFIARDVPPSEVLAFLKDELGRA